ncbi:four-carbon acid sugar kinase family protein [Pseudoroseomonas cervicalis]|uniref:YgbK domain protein n=1 Tax=Pseudoroseomonas cervicalis ATCC 49957 TaxID=525371 RepID=D5RRW9_9PROT|nr:four-carbon acid sugar kinase family protein [Pseudoroseomonas cervicalis]EFH09959.1 YgbK domain protein [Pseudoroseomonas cervicalis ATCC 49957]
MPLLGCIADDLVGANDLAAMLVAQGMRSVLVVGVPPAPLPEADAVIVLPGPGDALSACDALLAAGARQIFFQCAAGFDGPVADALLRRLQSGFALVCPAFPAQGRSIYQGHLFTGASLQGEEPSLPRALARQTEGGVGLLPFAVVEQGVTAIRQAMHRLRDGGRRYGIADALTEAHLLALGAACDGQALVIGGAGLAMGLPQNFRAAGLLPDRADADALPPPMGAMAVLCGDGDRATLAQIGMARLHAPVLSLDLLATPEAMALRDQALDWAAGRLSEARPIVIATAALPEQVAALHTRLGREAAEALVAETLAAIAEGLVARGVRQLMLAGDGGGAAVLRRLGITALRVGPQIDAGLPWMFAETPGLHLAIKPGHAGSRDIFLRAFQP